MAISLDGKQFLAKSFVETDHVFRLRALDSSQVIISSIEVQFSHIEPNNYVDLNTDAIINIPEGFSVSFLELYDETDNVILGTETLTQNNSFPYGGDLIVSSFRLTVS